MSTLEKVAYLKGLVEGLGLDAETKESKIISAIIETLDAMATEVDAQSENAFHLAEEIDAISEDMADIESVVFGGEADDEDDCDCGCCGVGDELSYEIDCPSCGEEISVEEETIMKGEVVCPKCGEVLEFDFGDDEDEED